MRCWSRFVSHPDIWIASVKTSRRMNEPTPTQTSANCTGHLGSPPFAFFDIRYRSGRDEIASSTVAVILLSDQR